jgi:hypothetical protein
MPFYVYEIPARRYREERNWGSEKEATSALKHVARRAVKEGASNDDLIMMSELKSGNKVFEGAIGQVLKP